MRVFGIFRGGIESGAASRRVAFVRFWPGENEIFFKKIRPAVDDSAERGNFVVPLNAGLHQSKVRRSAFWRVWDCKLDSILSRFFTSRERGGQIGNGIESFDVRKSRRNGWFFDIYIQGSKYNFLS